MFHRALLLSLGSIPELGSAGELPLVPVPPVVSLPPEDVQVGPVIVLASSVTVPADNAKNRPFMDAPVFIALTPFCEITVPLNAVVVSRVAELPILHQTLQGSPPVIDEAGDVTSADTVLKIHTPDPVRLRFPESEKVEVEQ